MTKTIVITGVSRGLGRAMTESFAAAGHRVLGCARSQAAIDELREALGPPHRFDRVDVVDDNAVCSWAQAVLPDAGRIDLLINNAALMNRVAPLWEVPTGEFDNMIDVNIKGVANVIRQFVPAMVQKQHGVIVNFSSGWGRGTSPNVAPYCATKWAVEGLTQALARELPRGMAAVALNPGIIDTDMLRIAWADDAADFPKPDEWARRAVPFLLKISASDNGKPLTVPGVPT